MSNVGGICSLTASHFYRKLNVENSRQKRHKISCCILEVLSNLTVFLWFGSNILAAIVLGNKFLTATWLNILQT